MTSHNYIGVYVYAVDIVVLFYVTFSYQVVSVLVPLRYDIVHVGGSAAQRQVFFVTMIQAAIKSGQLKLALSLIAEMKVSELLMIWDL